MKYQDSTAILIGSFDPFHEGHLHLLNLASNNFKKIIICVANNGNKINQTSLENRYIQILNFLKEKNLNYEVIKNNGLTVNLCKKLKVNHLIRGYRNYQDKLYEKSLIKIYKKQWKSISVHLYKAKKFINLNSTLIKNSK